MSGHDLSGIQAIYREFEMRIFSFLVAIVLFVFAALLIVLDEFHYAQLLQEILPGWLMLKITPRGNFLLLIGSLLVMGAVYVEHWYHERWGKKRESAQSSGIPHIEVNPEIKGIENKIEQHFHLPQNMMEDFGKQIAKALKELEVPEQGPAFPDPNQGFIQYESRSICISSQDEVTRVSAGDLKAGEIIRVQFHYANRGKTPVRDCQSWGFIAALDPAKNPGSRLREVVLNGIKEGYEKFKGAGSDLGVGLSVHNFAVGQPLSEQEIAGLKDGSLRVHLLLGGAWRDAKGQPYYWTNAEWTNWPEVSIERSFWKGA